jgi:hypothetical protein
MVLRSLTHCAFMCKGACRVHFGRDNTVHGVDRHCTWRPQVDVSQAQHQVGRFKHHTADLSATVQPKSNIQYSCVRSAGGPGSLQYITHPAAASASHAGGDVKLP